MEKIKFQTGDQVGLKMAKHTEFGLEPYHHPAAVIRVFPMDRYLIAYLNEAKQMVTQAVEWDEITPICKNSFE